MGTFLVTPRMSPELRARVERAVSRRARARQHAAAAGLSGTFAAGSPFRWTRVLPLLLLAVVAGLFVVMRNHERRLREADRGALLAELADRRAALPPAHQGLLAAADRALAELAAEPELVDPALRAPGALDAALRRPTLYVRGPAAELQDPARRDGAVKASMKDAFLHCLFHPPSALTERDLLAKVRGVYFGGAKLDDDTSWVRRLADARLALGPLGPPFEGAVRAAEDTVALKRLRRELGALPLDLARRAAAAELLLVVADTGPLARVALFDLGSGKPLARIDRKVAGMTLEGQATFHREDIEACALAVEARKALSP